MVLTSRKAELSHRGRAPEAAEAIRFGNIDWNYV